MQFKYWNFGNKATKTLKYTKKLLVDIGVTVT
jgi:hypothetical protein